MTRLSTLIAVLLSLVAALIDVESSGRDNVIDPTGRCWGPLQITQIYIDDVNRILGRHEYDRSDAFDRARSIQMFEVYVGHYATAERIGRTPTDEDRARIHAGGPDGWRQAKTLKYWRKVADRL